MTAMDPQNLDVWRALLGSWDAWLLTLALTVLIPVVGFFRFRQFLASSGEVVTTRTKLTLYGRIVCSQWLLVVAMLLILRRHGLSVADAGERLAGRQLTLGATGGLLLILAAVSAIILVRLRRARPKTGTRGLGRLRKLVPTFGLEMAAFAGVCLTAGICEELLFRGWLVSILWAATGSAWIAVAFGAILFGIGHAYQGTTAILRTAFVGLQLGVLFVWVGSLIPGQVLHTGVDLLVGVAGALTLSRQSSASAEPAADGGDQPCL